MMMSVMFTRFYKFVRRIEALVIRDRLFDDKFEQKRKPNVVTIDERPTINLAVHEGIGDEQLTQVLLGIEETNGKLSKICKFR